jgi:DNA-binding HxlR family transcriptional regulator
VKVAGHKKANNTQKLLTLGANHPIRRRESIQVTEQKATRCPAGIVSVGGRLKLRICYHLLGGTKRFGELQRLIPDASRQMLTLQLRELEQMGLLRRQVYMQAPPKVEYSLSPEARNAEPALRQFNAWGERFGLAF